MRDFKSREEYLHWMMAELQESYRKAAEPLIKELVRIESLKPPKPIYVSAILSGCSASPVDK